MVPRSPEGTRGNIAFATVSHSVYWVLMCFIPHILSIVNLNWSYFDARARSQLQNLSLLLCPVVVSNRLLYRPYAAALSPSSQHYIAKQ